MTSRFVNASIPNRRRLETVGLASCRCSVEMGMKERRLVHHGASQTGILYKEGCSYVISARPGYQIRSYDGTPVLHGRAPHGRVPHGRVPHGRVPYGCASHRRVPRGRVLHGRALHGRVLHGVHLMGMYLIDVYLIARHTQRRLSYTKLVPL